MDGLKEIKIVFDKLTQNQVNDVNGPQLDFSKGILQSIGYKEFYPFYEKFSESDSTAFENPKSIKNKEQKALLDNCIESLDKATVKYAKYQQRWLSQRIMPHFVKKDEENETK